MFAPVATSMIPLLAILITAWAPGTPWEQVAEDWVCPICGMGKDVFEKE